MFFPQHAMAGCFCFFERKTKDENTPELPSPQASQGFKGWGRGVCGWRFPNQPLPRKKVKMWHRILAATSSESEDRRREVSHALADTNGEDGCPTGDVAFAERLM